MKKMSKSLLTSILAIAFLLAMVPAITLSAAEPTIKKFSEAPHRFQLVESAYTVSPYGTNNMGIKVVSNGSGEALTMDILGFDIAQVQATPYLIMKLDESTFASKTPMPKLTFRVGGWGNGGDSRADVEAPSTPLDQYDDVYCIDLSGIVANDTTSSQITVSILIANAAGRTESVEFSALYLSSQKLEIKHTLTATAEATKLINEGSYYAKNDVISASVPEAGKVKIDAAGDNGRIIWADANALAATTPYLVYKIKDSDVSNFASFKFYTTLDATAKDLATTAGQKVVNISNLITELGDGVGFFYIVPALNADTSIEFEELYLTNVIPSKSDKTSLESALRDAKAVNLDKYLDGAEKDVFKKAITDAEALLLDVDAEQATVDSAVSAISTAKGKLVGRPDPSELNTLLGKIKNTNLKAFTDASVKALTDKMAEAEKLIASSATTKAQLDAMVVTLKKLQGELKPKANGSILRFLGTKSTGEGAIGGGGFFDDTTDFTYKKHGDIGLSFTYDGTKTTADWGNSLYVFTAAELNKMPYLVYEIDQSTVPANAADVPAISIMIGYELGEKMVHAVSNAKISSIKGCYALNIKELLKGKTPSDILYINMVIVGKTKQTVDFTRLYLSNTNADKTKIEIPFLPKISDGSYMDGGYYAASENVSAATYKGTGLSVTASSQAEDSRLLYAFVASLVDTTPYLKFEIEGSKAAVAHIKVSSPWSGNSNGINVPIKDGENLVNIKELLKDTDMSIGYFYIAITMNEGTVNFKNISLTDNWNPAGGNDVNSGQDSATVISAAIICSVAMLAIILLIAKKKSLNF